MKIVVKVGTNVLMEEGGNLNTEVVNSLAKQISESKHDIVLVSSGAIGVGMRHLGLKEKPQDMALLQASAAVGQSKLIEAYQKAFGKEKVVAQVLLTSDDFTSRRKYLNLRNTLFTLLKLKALPIVNENDTVSVSEIANVFSDNDELAALVANGLNADALILLTNVDGMYTENPKGGCGRLIPKVDEITLDFRKMCYGKSKFGRGGMLAKLKAAKVATDSGVKVVIANGSEKGCIQKAIDSKIGTTFIPKKKKPEKKKWMAFATKPAGKIYINNCAIDALKKKGASLLSVGIEKAEGKFKKGDVVSIVNEKGKEIARGIVNYSKPQVAKIKGKKSKEAKVILGFTYKDVIYRGNMAFV